MYCHLLKCILATILLLRSRGSASDVAAGYTDAAATSAGQWEGACRDLADFALQKPTAQHAWQPRTGPVHCALPPCSPATAVLCRDSITQIA